MKSMIRLTTLAAASCLLAACASSQEQASYSAPPRVDAPGAIVTDDAYVAAVERVARRRGIDIQWVNAPTKRQPRQ